MLLFNPTFVCSMFAEHPHTAFILWVIGGDFVSLFVCFAFFLFHFCLLFLFSIIKLLTIKVPS